VAPTSSFWCDCGNRASEKEREGSADVCVRGIVDRASGGSGTHSARGRQEPSGAYRRRRSGTSLSLSLRLSGLTAGQVCYDSTSAAFDFARDCVRALTNSPLACILARTGAAAAAAADEACRSSRNRLDTDRGWGTGSDGGVAG
jgi:hypothetical protein